MITEFSKAVCVPELEILGRARGRLSNIRETYWLKKRLNNGNV